MANHLNNELVSANDFLVVSDRSGSEISFDLKRSVITCKCDNEQFNTSLPAETIFRLGGTFRKLITAAVTQYADSLKKQFDAL